MKHEYVVMSKQYTKSLDQAKVIRVGKLLFISRETSYDRQANEIIGDDFKKAAKVCIENLCTDVQKEGINVESIVSTTVYLKSQEHINTLEELYSLYFGEKPPAKKVVEGRLQGNVLIEMDAIAIVR